MSDSYLKNVATVSDARNIFPVTESCVYLDSAHYSQFSLETRRRLIEFIDEYTYSNKNLSVVNLNLTDILRKKCGDLIGASPEDIIITGSTTHGLNIFANGIDLKEGECVAYADSEFPAVVYPWMNQEKLRGIRNVMIPSRRGQIEISDIETTIVNNNVKVLTISSVSFLGFRNDLEKVNEVCKRNNCLLVVDAIQSTGACPVNVTELGIDFFSAGAQKWMMSSGGIGFAYISPKMRKVIQPTYVSTNNVDYDFTNFLNYKLNFKNGGSAFDDSTPNTLGMIGLESSMDLFLKLGVTNIFNHIIELQNLFMDEIKGSDYIIESNLQPEHRSNIMIFSHIEKSLNSEIQKQLEKRNVFIALREGYLRLSAHLFNNREDILALCNALKEISSEKVKAGYVSVP